MRALRIDRSFIILALVLVISVGLWIQLGLINRDTKIKLTSNSGQPDYFIEKFVSSARATDGDIYILIGDYLEYFSDNRIIELQKPCLLLSKKGDPPQLVFGDEGSVIENGTVVVLRGNVNILEQFPRATDEPSEFPVSLMEASCFSSSGMNGTRTHAEELTLQLKPRLNY